MPLNFSRKHGLVLTDVHVNSTLACNLACMGCNSFSDMGIDDGFSLEDRLSWFESLHDFSSRLGISIPVFTILGGEPLLDDAWLQISQKINHLWPQSQIDLYTNGLMLSARKSWAKAAVSANVRIDVTIHDLPDKIKSKILQGVLVWRQAGARINLTGNGSSNDVDIKGLWAQTVIYQGDKVWPHDHGDHDAAWLRCSIRDCHTLQDHRLYHCPITALLPSLLRKTKQLEDVRWQPYLNYHPLDLRTANERDVSAFFASTPGKICAMCPKQNDKIDYVPAIPQDMHRFDRESWKPNY